ncbi:hypothetical protein AQUCO_01500010v1 [Aquilegia coerulea]|uniref:Secreted protein n=1 Tax=Aquilegia coerulea TaxID=218851 RepID=A0A2G5DRP6_AQUCA|nr:hypothetical protein AQUCO_01500010v1 [Aquilegia coerulea]
MWFCILFALNKWCLGRSKPDLVEHKKCYILIFNVPSKSQFKNMLYMNCYTARFGKQICEIPTILSYRPLKPHLYISYDARKVQSASSSHLTTCCYFSSYFNVSCFSCNLSNIGRQ